MAFAMAFPHLFERQELRERQDFAKTLGVSSPCRLPLETARPPIDLSQFQKEN